MENKKMAYLIIDNMSEEQLEIFVAFMLSLLNMKKEELIK